MKTTAMMFILGLFILVGCGETDVQPPPAVAPLGELSVPLTAGKFNRAKVDLSSDKPTYLAGETVQLTARLTDALQGGPITYGALELVATFPDGTTLITFTPSNQTDYTASSTPLDAAAPNILRVSVYQTDSVLLAKLHSQQAVLTQEIQNLKDQLAHESNLLKRAKLKITIKAKEAALADMERDLQGVSREIGSSSLGLVVYGAPPVTPDPCAANAQAVTLLERTFSRHIFPTTEHRTFTASGPGQICLSINNDDWITFRRVTNATVKVDDGTVVAPSEFGSNATYIEKREAVTSGNHDLAVKINDPFFGYFDLKIKFLPDDTTPPTIQITEPQNGSTLSSIIGPVNITYSDNVGINPSSLSVTLNGKDITSEFAASSSAASAQEVVFAEGSNTIVATIRDLSGNPVTSSVNGTVLPSSNPCNVYSGALSIFGPTQFKRKLVPVEQVEQLDGHGGGIACVKVMNGDNTGAHRAKAGEVKIDGATMVSCQEFGENVAYIKKPVKLSTGFHELGGKVGVLSCLGSYFTVEVTGLVRESLPTDEVEALDGLTEEEAEQFILEARAGRLEDNPNLVAAISYLIRKHPALQFIPSFRAEIVKGVGPMPDFTYLSNDIEERGGFLRVWWDATLSGLPGARGLVPRYVDETEEGLARRMLSRVFTNFSPIELLDTKDDDDGTRTLRFIQRVEGYPVYGGAASAVFSGNDLVYFSGFLAPPGASLPHDIMNKESAISAVDLAINRQFDVPLEVLNSFGSNASLVVVEPQLVDWEFPYEEHMLFWQVIKYRFVGLVEAVTGELVFVGSLGDIAQLKIHAHQGLAGVGTKEEVCRNNPDYNPPGEHLLSVDTLEVGSLPGANGVTRFDWTDVGEVLDNVRATRDFYESLGWHGVTFNDTLQPYVASINVRSIICPYLNAAWVAGFGDMPPHVEFGVGTSEKVKTCPSRTVFVTRYARARDVVAHEFTHGVHFERAGETWSNCESAALNEAIPDLFGKFTEYWHTGILPKDWNWGVGHSLTSDNRGLRNMRAPEDGFCHPTRPSEMVCGKWAENKANAHDNAGPINRAHSAILVGRGNEQNGYKFIQNIFRADFTSPKGSQTFSSIRSAYLTHCFSSALSDIRKDRSCRLSFCEGIKEGLRCIADRKHYRDVLD